MTHREDEPLVVEYSRDEMHEWLATGGGASLTPEQLAEPELPAGTLPEPGTPISVMRNVRMPWTIDLSVKVAADAVGVSVSEWIRDAVLARLAAEPGDEPNPAVELHLIVAAATRALGHLPGREAA